MAARKLDHKILRVQPVLAPEALGRENDAGGKHDLLNEVLAQTELAGLARARCDLSQLLQSDRRGARQRSRARLPLRGAAIVFETLFAAPYIGRQRVADRRIFLQEQRPPRVPRGVLPSELADSVNLLRRLTEMAGLVCEVPEHI